MPLLMGRKTSSNVQKVMWTLAEIGVDYEQVEMGGKFGSLDRPDFVKINPVKLVPVWREDDGFQIFESHAVMRYLDRTRDGGLMPADPRAAGIADQWMEVASTGFIPAVIGVFWQVVRTAPAQRNPDAIAAAVKKLDAASAVLETRLADSPWLAGEDFTLADIAAGTLMHRYWTMDIPRPERPALKRWTEALRARPTYSGIVETSYEDLRAK